MPGPINIRSQALPGFAYMLTPFTEGWVQLAGMLLGTSWRSAPAD
jgi:hypothetical protein